MKKIILACFICVFALNLAQNQTKKWNSVTERYEYFDFRGYLLGYEKYNSILKQWEYFDFKRENKYENYNKDTDDFYSALNKQQDDVINNLLQKKQQQNQLYSSPQPNKSSIEPNDLIGGSKTNLLKKWYHSIVKIYKIEQYETINGKNQLLDSQITNNYKLYIDENLLSFLIDDKPAFKKNIVLLNYIPQKKGYFFKNEENDYVFITEDYNQVQIYSGRKISIYHIGNK